MAFPACNTYIDVIIRRDVFTFYYQPIARYSNDGPAVSVSREQFGGADANGHSRRKRRHPLTSGIDDNVEAEVLADKDPSPG
jgi:hypothetical protein